MSSQYLNSQLQKSPTEKLSARNDHKETGKIKERDTKFESMDFANMVNCNCLNLALVPIKTAPNDEDKRSPVQTQAPRTSENIIYAMNNVRMQRLEEKVASPEAKHLATNTLQKIQNLPPGSDIRFSVIMPNNEEVSVRAFENPDHWRVSMEARDVELKKRIEKSRTQMAESMRKELGKKVLIDVQ